MADFIGENTWPVVRNGVTHVVAVRPGDGANEAEAALTESLAPPPDAVSLAWAKVSARAQVLAMIAALAERMTATYPQCERDTWTTQESAARAFVADNQDAAAIAVLAPCIAGTTTTMADFAAAVIGNADAFRALGLALVGVRKAASESITAATTMPEVNIAVAAAQAAIQSLD